jgi:uncharacterized protein (TIRG00374 family)
VSNRSRVLVGLLISAIALVAALWGIHPDKILDALQRADFVFLGLSMATLLLTLVFRAFRWRVLLGHGVSVWRAWWMLNIGYLLNTVLPGRVGEVARAYLISREHAFDSFHALSSVALERIFDLLSVALLFGLSLPWVKVPQEFAGAGTLIAVGSLLALAAMFLVVLLPGPVQRAGETLITLALRLVRRPAERWLARWERLFASVTSGLSALRDLPRLLVVLFWTAALWLSAIGTIYFGIGAFERAHQSLPLATFVLSCLGGAVSIPSSPGQIGVYEYTARLTLGLNGMPDDLALTIGLVMHAMNLLPLIVLGAIGLGLEGESLGRLAQETAAWLARARGGSPAPAVAAEGKTIDA